MARLRSTKLRAQRIELDYFKRAHPLRRWRLWLALAGMGGAAAWVGWTVARGDLRPVAPGPVASAHALFDVRCEACHGPVAAADDGPRWQGATDAACERCHTTAAHETNERTTPPCTACHVEHRGRTVLAAVPSARCTGCHADLDAHTKGTPRVVGADGRALHGLADGHPEFAVWIGHGAGAHRVRLGSTPPPEDTTPLRLNHKLHLKADLHGPSGPVQLVCEDCHQGPMALAANEPEPADAPDLAPAEEPAYLAPPRFARHCAGCHPNSFDARFPDLPAPHDRPEVIHAFLRGVYADYIVAHPDELTDARRTLLGREPTPPVQGPGEWVTHQVHDAEALLFSKPGQKCQECHLLDWPTAAAFPTVAPTRIPIRWLPQSVFNHGTHRFLDCTECHAAPSSERTTDILMPRLETCQTCHHPGGAEDRCAECHTYHAATTPTAIRERQTIQELTGVELSAP